MRAAKVQASLRIRAVSPEPPLLAHTSSESRGTFRQKARGYYKDRKTPNDRKTQEKAEKHIKSAGKHFKKLFFVCFIILIIIYMISMILQ